MLQEAAGFLLDYYNALHMGLPLKMFWKLQVVQNNAAIRLIPTSNRPQYHYPLLKTATLDANYFPGPIQDIKP